MPIPSVKFDPEGADLSVSIAFKTPQVVRYELELLARTSNTDLLDVTGDNQNEADDDYPLPTPVALNDGRRIYCGFTFIDPRSKPSGPYRADVIVKQGKATLVTLSATGTMTKHDEEYLVVAKLVADRT